MTENDFDIFLPSPLHIAFREAINDVFGWRRGKINKTAELAIYEWLVNNKPSLGQTAKEALEAYEEEYKNPQPTPLPEPQQE